mmetsp:Transcript_53143/g.92726  ORF Transcript_53143/g.92726 Transcript_53143/m.92726 type:complete len:125 (+) Transcript_53143:198-572(+)
MCTCSLARLASANATANDSGGKSEVIPNNGSSSNGSSSEGDYWLDEAETMAKGDVQAKEEEEQEQQEEEKENEQADGSPSRTLRSTTTTTKATSSSTKATPTFHSSKSAEMQAAESSMPLSCPR